MHFCFDLRGIGVIIFFPAMMLVAGVRLKVYFRLRLMARHQVLQIFWLSCSSVETAVKFFNLSF